jgi:hypothetical protein
MIRVPGWLNKLCDRFHAIRGRPCQRITDKVEAIQVLRGVRQNPDWNQQSRPHRGQLRSTTTLIVVPIHLGVSAAMTPSWEQERAAAQWIREALQSVQWRRFPHRVGVGRESPTRRLRGGCCLCLSVNIMINLID